MKGERERFLDPAEMPGPRGQEMTLEYLGRELFGRGVFLDVAVHIYEHYVKPAQEGETLPFYGKGIAIDLSAELDKDIKPSRVSLEVKRLQQLGMVTPTSHVTEEGFEYDRRKYYEATNSKLWEAIGVINDCLRDDDLQTELE